MIAVPVFRVYRIGREPSLGETFAIEAGPFAARPQTSAWPKGQATCAAASWRRSPRRQLGGAGCINRIASAQAPGFSGWEEITDTM